MEGKRKDASTFWISSLRTGSRCSSGVYMKTMMCLRYSEVNGTKIALLNRFIQECKITKERQTLVLSRITNSSVVFRGLNKRIMTYKLRCPNVIITSGDQDCVYKANPERTKSTWNTVFRSGLLAACSRPISWHHLQTYR